MKSFNYNYFIKTLDKKKFFLLKVYSTLIFQIFIAFVILFYVENKNIELNKTQYIGVCIATFIIIILLTFIQSKIIRFILLVIFSALVGLILSAQVDLDNEKDLEIVKKSFVTTVFIFIYMIIFGFIAVYMGATISPVISIILFFSLLLLIIMRFILSIRGNFSKYYKIFAGCVILLFSLFIIYDTVEILDREYNNDFIHASADYFLDFINIFSQLVEIQIYQNN